MNIVRLLPVIVSALLMAAHFSRADNMALLALSLAFPFILVLRRPWVAHLTRVALVLASLEWMRTAVGIAGRRQAAGESWTRMAVILGSVAALTLASGLVFNGRDLRARYGLSSGVKRDREREIETM